MVKDLNRGILVAVYGLGLLLVAATITRMVPYYIGTPYQWTVIALLTVFLILFLTERPISLRINGYVHGYFLLQLAIRLALLFIPTYDAPQDYFTNLVLPLCGQAMLSLPPRVGRYWVGVFALFAMATMIAYYHSWDGVGFGLTYIAGCILIAVLSAVTLNADKARRETQALLADLQVANQKLEAYARQAEDLATVQERNRLARELHDVVSQIIFSMTLTAQAAKILLERDPARVPAQLDHLQSLSQSALAEMRALIQHLRPRTVAEEGLPSALRQLAVERLARDGLIVNVQVSGERRLPEFIEEGLYRITQEALSNVAKHAGVKQASVELHLEGDPISLSIEDHGAGFVPSAAENRSGHLGLANIADRVRALNGALTIESAPGDGTRIRVENISVKEGEYA
ncbi:MAG: sensor histidine kinase [Chloroflexi bacterium]|nr:sensor histidine kinase [Chloroflexota bacterium]